VAGDLLEKLFICNNMTNKYIVWFDEIGLDDVSLVGGKNSSLGEMICNLKQLGIQVPFGFAITTHAYQYFLEYNNLVEQIKNNLKNVNYEDHVDLCRTAQKIRLLIKNGEFPKDLEIEILQN
jgi:pyruvate,water dikinase